MWGPEYFPGFAPGLEVFGGPPYSEATKGDDGNEYAYLIRKASRGRCEPGRNGGGKSSPSRQPNS